MESKRRANLTMGKLDEQLDGGWRQSHCGPKLSMAWKLRMWPANEVEPESWRSSTMGRRGIFASSHATANPRASLYTPLVPFPLELLALTEANGSFPHHCFLKSQKLPAAKPPSILPFDLPHPHEPRRHQPSFTDLLHYIHHLRRYLLDFSPSLSSPHLASCSSTFSLRNHPGRMYVTQLLIGLLHRDSSTPHLVIALCDADR